jgi:hypothetical protein
MALAKPVWWGKSILRRGFFQWLALLLCGLAIVSTLVTAVLQAYRSAALHSFLAVAAAVTLTTWTIAFLFLGLFFGWRAFRYSLLYMWKLRDGFLGKRLEALWNPTYGFQRKHHTEASLVDARLALESLLAFPLTLGLAWACQWLTRQLALGGGIAS